MQQATRKLIAGIIAAGAAASAVQGQSNDALLKKLVDKGILTTQEAEALRAETDNGVDKAIRARTGLPDWVTQLKFYGDVRGRYEMFRIENDDPGAVNNQPRDRFRFRLRAGATVTMKDNFELGFRLASGDTSTDGQGGDPISSNATMQNNGSKKSVYVDLAYGKWTAIKTGPWLVSGTVGKMENPFVVSDMVFDPDYTPEGAAIQVGYAINDHHGIKLNTAAFVLDEINQGSQNSNDPWMYGIQLRYDGTFSSHLTGTAGIGWYAITEDENLGNGAVPNVNVGNTRDSAGNLVNDYYPVVADLGITYTLDKFQFYPGKFPIRVAGEYMHNPGADENSDGMWGGIFFGKAAKKGSWELSYRYKYLENDAWWEEFTDSDYGAYYPVGMTGNGRSSGGVGSQNGTGVKGHIVKTAYAVSDSFTIGASWFYTDLIHYPTLAGKQSEGTQHRVQVDATWKF